MANRFHSEEVVFRRPFRLKGAAQAEPAGTYLVETEEELIEGLSFPAWHRVATTLSRQVPAGATRQVIPVAAKELAELQARDAAAG